MAESAPRGEKRPRRARTSTPRTGRELAAVLLKDAREHGWRYVHFRAAGIRAGRWVTPYDGDGGFPDVVLARRGSVLVLELKGRGDTLRPGQLEWVEAAGAPLGGMVNAGVVGKRELAAVQDYLAGRIGPADLRVALRPRLERAWERSA